MVPKAYMWKDGKWEYAGEVVTQQPATPKRHYYGDRFFPEGEYDYVFDVDVAEGAPKAVLPYNEGDNPLVVAEKFLTREGMGLAFKEQITDFIRKNTRGGGKATGQPSQSAPQKPAAPPLPKSCFPLRNTVFYEQMNIDGLVHKITEFNHTLHESGDLACLTENELKYITNLANKLRDPKIYAYIKEFSSFEIEVAKKLCRWPASNFVPVMDLWRCLVLHHASQVFFAGVDSGMPLVASLVGKLKNGAPVLWTLFPKLLSNLFIHTSNSIALVRSKDIIAEGFNCLNRNEVKHVGFYANYLMNCSSCIDQIPSVTDEFVTDLIHQAGDLAMNGALDGESTLKLAIAIGNFAALRPSVASDAHTYMEVFVDKMKDLADENSKNIVSSFRAMSGSN